MLSRLLIALAFLIYTSLVVLFLTGYAATYLHPGHFWWAAIVAVALPYVSLALVFATVWVIALRRWQWMVFHGVLFVMMAVRFWDFSFVAGQVEPGRGDLIFMTYNVPEREAERRALNPGQVLMQLIQDEEADFVSLQDVMVYVMGPPDELHVNGHLRQTLDSLEYVISKPHEYGIGHYFRNAVISRSEPIQQERIVLDTNPRDPVITYVTRKRFQFQGRPFVHYNVHLRSFGDPKPWHHGTWSLSPSFWWPFVSMYQDAYRNRASEVRQIREMIGRESDPVVISGDLNSTPHNWEYRQLSHGMQDAFKIAGSGWGATYHSRLPLVRIDYLLFGPEWEVVSAHVPAGGLSDHRPVVARVRWRDGSSINN